MRARGNYKYRNTGTAYYLNQIYVLYSVILLEPITQVCILEPNTHTGSYIVLLEPNTTQSQSGLKKVSI